MGTMNGRSGRRQFYADCGFFCGQWNCGKRIEAKEKKHGRASVYHSFFLCQRIVLEVSTVSTVDIEI
jgi:hypothetical protein